VSETKLSLRNEVVNLESREVNMDLEPQKRKEELRRPERRSPQKEADEFPAVEGMTERDHKTEEFAQSPLKVFIGALVLLLGAALVLGITYYIFFH